MGVTLAASAVAALVVAAYFGGKERLRRALSGAAAAAVAAIFVWHWVREGRVPTGFYCTGLLFTFAAACIGASAERLFATFASAGGAVALVLWAVFASAPEGQPRCAALLMLPHAVGFMAGYALLLVGAASAGASFAWKEKSDELARTARSAARLALGFLSAGTVLAAFAARIVWGEYWAWDAREAAALVVLALVAASRITGAHTSAGKKLLIVAAAAAAVVYFAVGLFSASRVSLHPG